MKEMNNIKEGEMILLSSGEYSDYFVSGLAVALVDINTSEIRNDYINEHPDCTVKYEFNGTKFIKYLIDHSLIKITPYKEWYMGAYACIDDMTVNNNRDRWS